MRDIVSLRRKWGFIIIRTPPHVGKSTLLKLVGRNILAFHQDIEPVKICWEDRTSEARVQK